jgi:short-subunit dehydrogenase
VTRDLVVVVGAGPRLGRAVATAFARKDADVVMLARDGQRVARLAEETAALTGGAVHGIGVDAADEKDLRDALGDVRREHGDPTVLVHNPSIAVEATATATPYAAFLDGLRATAGSLLVAAQEVAPAMRAAGRGTVVVTGSGSALTGSTWSAGLAVQKAAVRNLAMSLETELRPDGVHVVTVTIMGTLGAPGYEPERIADEYVRLHELTDGEREAWQREIVWAG